MILAYLVFSYFIGCMMFGYLVTKLFFRQDLREHGSGNVGARNAGRLHGKTAFVLIFLGDALKGAAVILAARYFQYSEPIQLLGLGLAIIGHVKPITLGFKGGKGISTFIGGIILIQPLLIPVIIIAFLILYPITKSFTFSGLGAFLAIPLFLAFYQGNWLNVGMVCGILVLIFTAHIENIKERLAKKKG